MFRKEKLSYPYLVVLLVVIGDSLANVIFGIVTQQMNAEVKGEAGSLNSNVLVICT